MRKLLLLIVLAAAAFGWWYVRERGFSARAEPAAFEEFVAKRLRHLSVPAKDREMRNPLPAGEAVLADGRAHWADHCAICHGNDGRGQTEIGTGLYPKAPNMREDDTQKLTDGELFYIIKNGVRFTGMPAWGDPQSTADDESNWKLVHFIRHLPKLTSAEIQEMERLNPKGHGHAEMSSGDEQRFLQGKDDPAPPASSPGPSPGTRKP